MNRRRVGIKRSYRTLGSAELWLESLQTAAATVIEPGQTLATYAATIGDRWERTIDRTSTYDPYSAGLRLRVLPGPGHLPVGMITAGLVDRAIDEWEVRAVTIRRLSEGRARVRPSTAVGTRQLPRLGATS